METFLGDLFSEGLVKVIYLTLFHSLWQGALIAVIAGIIMLTTRRTSSDWRYKLLLSSMLLFVCCTAFTFIKQSGNMNASRQAVHIYSIDPVSLNSVRSTPSQNNILNITDSIVSFFNTNATAIVIFWFIIICLKCIQLLMGMSVTVALRNRHILPAGEYWENRLQELSAQLEIRKYIRISQSGLAKMPLTIGYFKPVILIPLGLLAAIPQDQIEAILLHELAHIKRRDYLVNIIQSLVEILFFFNPAIWWLSSLLRTERENCCDDLAVSRTSNKADYIKALVAFEEYHGITPKYASAITGSKNQLLKRVKRLIYNHNKTLNPMEKIILTCGLVVTGMLTVAFTQVEKHIIRDHNISSKAPINLSESEKTVFLQDTTRKATSSQTSSISTNVNGKKYRIISKNDIVTELYIDDIRIPAEKIASYKSVTDKIIEDSRKAKLATQKAKAAALETKRIAEVKKKDAQAKTAIKVEKSNEVKIAAKDAKELTAQAKVSAKASKIESDEIRAKTEEIDRKIEKLKELKNELKNEKRIEKDIRIETGEREIKGKLGRAAIERYKAERPERPTSPERVKRAERIMEYAPGDLFLADSRDLRDSRLRERAKTQIRPARPIEAFKYKKDSISLRPVPPLQPRTSFGTDLANELFELGIITDKKNLSFHITNEELTVNGVKQSEDVRQKVMSKIRNDSSGKFEFTYSSK